MMDILIPVLLVVAMGFVFAVILTIASKIFFVPVEDVYKRQGRQYCCLFFGESLITMER